MSEQHAIKHTTIAAMGRMLAEKYMMMPVNNIFRMTSWTAKANIKQTKCENVSQNTKTHTGGPQKQIRPTFPTFPKFCTVYKTWVQPTKFRSGADTVQVMLMGSNKIRERKRQHQRKTKQQQIRHLIEC